MRKQRGEFYKKAVSPLIATVLLISFAVALGSVVLNWGRNLDISTSKDVCSQAELKIRSMGLSEVCYVQKDGKTSIHFVLDNAGSIPIQGLGIWIVGQKGTKLLEFDSFHIAPEGVLDVNDDRVWYETESYGSIKHVQFIPKVRSEDSLDICPGNSVKAEKVRAC